MRMSEGCNVNNMSELSGSTTIFHPATASLGDVFYFGQEATKERTSLLSLVFAPSHLCPQSSSSLVPFLLCKDSKGSSMSQLRSFQNTTSATKPAGGIKIFGGPSEQLEDQSFYALGHARQVLGDSIGHGLAPGKETSCFTAYSWTASQSSA